MSDFSPLWLYVGLVLALLPYYVWLLWDGHKTLKRIKEENKKLGLK